MKVLVTGATGFLGGSLTRRLHSMGWDVTALGRNPKKLNQLEDDGIRVLQIDLKDKTALANACKNQEIVFHCAALPSPWGNFELFYQANVIGTRNVIAAAIENNVERFVFFSTVAVYGESNKMLDESVFPKPATAYGSSKLDAERLVLAASELKTTVLRLPVVYGARDRGNVAKLIEAIRRNRYFIVGAGQNLKSMVAVENVVSAALLVANDERAIGETFLVTDERPYSQEEIAATIAKLLGRKQPAKLPRWLLLLAGQAGDLVERLTGINLPFSSDRIRKLSSNTIYSSAKIESVLGFKPQVALHEGLADVINPISNLKFERKK